MRVEFVCPHCKATILAPESLAGESAPCPRCHHDIDSWPAPETTTPPRMCPKMKRSFFLPLGILTAILLFCTGGFVYWMTFHRSRTDVANTTSNVTEDERDGRKRTIVGNVKLVTMDIESAGWVKSDSPRSPKDGQYILILNLGRGVEAQCSFSMDGIQDSWFGEGIMGSHQGEKVTVRGVLNFRDDKLVILSECELLSHR